MKHRLFWGLCTVVLVFSSCMTAPPPTEAWTPPPAGGRDGGSTLSPVQLRILEGAGWAQGRSSLEVRGRRFAWDCTGTILAVYFYAGLDLSGPMAAYAGNGVKRLYELARQRDLLYHSPVPVPGDIIFWDNTYDANEDGRWNDELTHAGIVVAVDADARISYLHHNVSRGIVVEYMSLKEPDLYQEPGGPGKLVNSPMRLRKDRAIRPDTWLAGQLYRRLGRLYEVD